MIFTIQSSDFLRTLGAVSKIMDAKSAMPILDNVLFFEPSPGHYALMGSSSEHSAVIDVPIRMKEGTFHEVCMSAKTLLGVVSLLSECPIDVDVQPLPKESAKDTTRYEIVLRYKGGVFQFVGDDPKEYPRFRSNAEPICNFTIPASRLLPYLKIVAAYCAHDDLRPVLSGLCICARNEGVSMYGASKVSMCRYQYCPGAPFLIGTESDIIIPTRVVNVLTSLFQPDSDITVTYNGNNVLFEAEGASAQIRNLEGRAPRFEAVFPKDANQHVSFDTKEFRRVLQLVTLAANSAIERVVLESTGGLLGKSFTVRASDVDYSLSSSQELLPVPSVVNGGDDPDITLADGFKVAFRSSFMQRVLGSISTPNVRLFFRSPEQSFLIREDDPNSTLLFLLMPMQLDF